VLKITNKKTFSRKIKFILLKLKKQVKIANKKKNNNKKVKVYIDKKKNQQ